MFPLCLVQGFPELPLQLPAPQHTEAVSQQHLSEVGSEHALVPSDVHCVRISRHPQGHLVSWVFLLLFLYYKLKRKETRLQH